MKQITKYLFVGLFAAVLVAPSVSSAQTATDLQAQIQALLAQLLQLQAQLVAQQGGGTTWCHTFNTNLGIGNPAGAEVDALRTALTKEGFANVSTELGNNQLAGFDEALASAVSGFQEKYRSEILTPAGLSAPSGYVGPRTRAKLNALYGCGMTTSPTPTPTTQPSITVLSPNGGERWPLGSTQIIRWSGSAESLYVWKSNQPVGAPVYTIFSHPSIADTSGAYNWWLPTNDSYLTTGSYIVQVVGCCSTQQPNVPTDNSDAPFSIVAATTSTTSPSIHISGSSGNQVSDSSISVNLGNTFTISGMPQNLQGLSYWFGNGSQPSSGYFSRAYFFDQTFGNNNLCGNNDAPVNGVWTMTCTAKVSGSSYFYIEIYANGQIYRSNTVNVTIAAQTSAQPVVYSITDTTTNTNNGTYKLGDSFRLDVSTLGALVGKTVNLCIDNWPAGATGFTQGCAYYGTTNNSGQWTGTGTWPAGNTNWAGTWTEHAEVTDSANTYKSPSVTFTLSAPTASVSVSPTSLSFTATQGGNNPPAQTLTINPSLLVGWSLSWGCSTYVSGALNCHWFTLSGSGSTASSYQTGVDISGLSAGTYSGTITLFNPSNTVTQTVPVTLTVTAQAATSVTYLITDTTTYSSIFKLGDSFLLEVGTNPAWIGKTVNLCIDSKPSTATDVPLGCSYYGTTNNNGKWTGTGTWPSGNTNWVGSWTEHAEIMYGYGLNPRSPSVTFTLAAPATAASLSVSPTSLSFTAAQGGASPSSQQLTLTNFPDSGGQISTTATSCTPLVASTGCTWSTSWLTSTLSGSGTTKTLTVSVSNTTNLQAGTYNGSILFITSSQTITVPVTLTVTAASTTGSAAQVSQVQGLTATASGSSITLSWSAATASAGVGLYNVYRGTSASFTPSVSNRITQGNVLSWVDSNLSPGTYYYSVTAQDANGVIGPASAAASATIVSSPSASLGSLSVSPTSLSFTATQGGSNPASQILTVSGNASWNISIPSGSSWLSTSLTPGVTYSNNAGMFVYANQSGLSAGTYTGSIYISGNAVPAVIVPVTLTVTNTVQSPSASLSLSASSYTISNNTTFTLALSSNQLGKLFRLCSIQNGTTNPCTSYMPTNYFTGGYTWTGVWDQASYAGSWREWVEFQDPAYASPYIFFALTAPTSQTYSLNQMASILESAKLILEEMLKSLR